MKLLKAPPRQYLLKGRPPEGIVYFYELIPDRFSLLGFKKEARPIYPKGWKRPNK